ncbi:plasma membrane ascorbate-dependent reductase CYBRD1 isoform X1 [Anastrepha obliqua]|uniref:plasma membrane ascorbate-dependent reductase CYBRD1 isoform X1 n=1 Tax=Anastrepha obliqua TaxID=95512 RepID=UPI002409450E|nr:plasma membrane ascorbate-dependent reductase CYBRD1 isoform X1 [Anastrepha obliqua]
MPSENEKDIEIGNKVENVGASDNMESVSTPTTPANAAPSDTAAPSAVVVVSVKPAMEESAPADNITNGNSNAISAAADVALNREAAASQSQEQPPKHESTAMQANLHPVMQPMQQTIAGKMDEDATLTNFKVLYILTQLCGVTMIILVGCWVGIHFGGVGGTANPKLEFNWHPLFMTIGLIFLYGNSILVYRGFRNVRKKTLKLSHAGIHLTAFVLTVIALITVFDSHNLADPPIPNMYSLHSWLGLGAVIVFGLQYVAGFTAYLAPGWRQSLKVAYMPLHIYFGLFGFVLAIASALMGVTEKALFAISDYSSFSNAGVMANCIGVFYVIFGALVVYLATESSYKREPLPEDAVLLTGVNE